jgi:hypothetical protein
MNGNDNMKARYKRLKAEGRCVRCGKKDKQTLSGRVCCFPCAVRKSKLNREYREKKKTAESGNSQAVNKK